jgi:hypothetical protein
MNTRKVRRCFRKTYFDLVRYPLLMFYHWRTILTGESSLNSESFFNLLSPNVHSYYHGQPWHIYQWDCFCEDE